VNISDFFILLNCINLRTTTHHKRTNNKQVVFYLFIPVLQTTNVDGVRFRTIQM